MLKIVRQEYTGPNLQGFEFDSFLENDLPSLQIL